MPIPSSKRDLFAVTPTADEVDLGSVNELQQLEISLAEASIKSHQAHAQHEVFKCIVCNRPINKDRRKAIPGVQTCIKDQQRIDNGEIDIAEYL